MKKLGVGCLALVGFAVVLLVIVVVVVAVGSSGGGSDDTANDSSNSGSSAKGSGLDATAGTPNRVKVGSAFRLGDFKINKGWKVQNLGEDFGYNIKGLEVQNVTGSAHTFSADIKLHQGKDRISATISCIASEAKPKNIVEVDCLPDGSGKKWTYATIENSF